MILREEYDARTRASRVLDMAQHPDWECLKEELLVTAYNYSQSLCAVDLSSPAKPSVAQGWIQALSYVAEGLTGDLRHRLREERDDALQEE